MSALTDTLVRVTLFGIMLALGIGLRLESLKTWLSRPALPLRVTLGSCLLVPLLGLVLLQTPWSQEIGQPARTAIALMALCPSAPLALRKTRKAGGDDQLAALVQVAAALAAVVTVPLLGIVFRNSFGVEGWEVRPLDVAVQVGQVQVLPLALGLALREWRPSVAQRLEAPLDRLANGLLALLVVLVLLKTSPLLVSFVPSNLGAIAVMLAMSLGSVGIGVALARPDQSHALTTGTVTAMRNPGLALLFAGHHGAGLDGLKLGILLYVLITVLVSLPLLSLRPRAVP